MEEYPNPNFYDKSDLDKLFQIFSITYNVKFLFLPYDLKITESLTPEWNQESVLGRMDSIATFKRMTRTMTASFKVRSIYGDKRESAIDTLVEGNSIKTNIIFSETKPRPYLPFDDLLHAIDHVKKCLYPRYNKEQVVTSPPLFRIKYANLIAAGEETYNNGVLCYITAFSANPVMDINKLSYKTPNSRNIGSVSDGVYPKIFDISVTFTVLNENLVSQQINGILNNRYFYKYSTSIGPNGGHGSASSEATPEQLDDTEIPLSAEEKAQMDAETKANEEKALSETGR